MGVALKDQNKLEEAIEVKKSISLNLIMLRLIITWGSFKRSNKLEEAIEVIKNRYHLNLIMLRHIITWVLL